MMTQSKADPTKRWVIVDLSFLPGKSVNAGLPCHEYLGLPASYTLPSAADLARCLVDEGIRSYTWTAYVAWDYPQLLIDPLLPPLFGITLNGATYVDVALPFG